MKLANVCIDPKFVELTGGVFNTGIFYKIHILGESGVAGGGRQGFSRERYDLYLGHGVQKAAPNAIVSLGLTRDRLRVSFALFVATSQVRGRGTRLDKFET